MDPNLHRRDQNLIQITDIAFADSASRSGPHLVCHPGCTQCCHGAFAINALDALRLRTAMAEMAIADPARAEAIATRAKLYLEEFAPDFPGNQRTGILGASEENREAFEDFANDVACPALDPATGLCDLYDGRPMTCRIFGPPVRTQSHESAYPEESEGLAVCELCFTQATTEEIAAAEMTVPHAEEEELLSQIQEARPDLAADARPETIIAYCLTDSPPQPRPQAAS